MCSGLISGDAGGRCGMPEINLDQTLKEQPQPQEMFKAANFLVITVV